ncbi:hypothetical protein [Chroococcidiopsis sp. CCALA 051]|nr:hypothetical protein [Chroococcidiopsis sp. CCALA 051]
MPYLLRFEHWRSLHLRRSVQQLLVPQVRILAQRQWRSRRNFLQH